MLMWIINSCHTGLELFAKTFGIWTQRRNPLVSVGGPSHVTSESVSGFLAYELGSRQGRSTNQRKREEVFPKGRLAGFVHFGSPVAVLS